MKYPVLHVPFLNVEGMALFPFILIKERHRLQDNLLINHEHIHLVQQLEMLILPFYLLYLMNYLWNRLKGMNHYTAYRSIPFEKEAYAAEADLTYLKKRRFWAWMM